MVLILSRLCPEIVQQLSIVCLSWRSVGGEWDIGNGLESISKVGQRLDISMIYILFLSNIYPCHDTVIYIDFQRCEVPGQIMDKDWTLGCPMLVQF